MSIERRLLGAVGLELLEGGPDRRVLVGGVVQLDNTQGRPVAEEHDIRPARKAGLADRELVDRQPVVVFWLIKGHSAPVLR